MRAPGAWPALLALALVFPAWAQQAEQEQPTLPPGLGEELVEEDEEPSKPERNLPTGFVEVRLGPRLQDDPAHSKQYTLAEARLQLAWERAWKRLSFEAKGDLAPDAVTERAETDLRQLQLTLRPAASLDVQLGRQVVTWGTGDLLFINDLFPKDWQSFFIGRDEEYLKAPSDALRVGWFAGRVNLDLVYTPEVEPDRYIRGERISFWGGTGFRGDAMPLAVDIPDDAFDDDEIALRVYGNAGSYEIAGYAYTGFWKSPAGFDPATMRATFPGLDVWGASARGPLGPGIGNVELGYYDSRDDPRGEDPFVNNGELRLLLGYELELGRELTGGFQYYLERILDHDSYVDNLPAGEPRDENRHVLTARITKLLKGQTVIPQVFVYYSPSDRDGYLRPKLVWKRTDRQILELGANLFVGRDDFTFFGQFENNSNLYASLRFQL